MKKIFLLSIALILSACSPQVTQQTSDVLETSEVLTATPTDTPIPTPTLHPDFMAWQELISSSGRYTLTPAGLIQDGDSIIKGLQVDSNGVMTLEINNEKITLTTKDIEFSEDGIKTEDYQLDDNGEWVEAAATVKLDNGAVLTLDDANGDGISEVTEVSVDNDNLTDKQKELLVNQLNPGYVGFTPDEAKLYYDAETQNYWVGSADDPSNMIARQDEATGTLIWDFDKMKDGNGESVLFRIAKTWEMDEVNPVDMEEAKIDSQSLRVHVTATFKKDVDYSGYNILTIYIYDVNHKYAIGSEWLTTRMTPDQALEFERADVEGDIFFLDKVGNLVSINVENLDCTTRFWK